jgi:hypothetical protein
LDDGTQPDAQPHVRGASRGKGDPRRDADAAGRGRRSASTTEYAANAQSGEAGQSEEDGDVEPR